MGIHESLAGYEHRNREVAEPAEVAAVGGSVECVNHGDLRPGHSDNREGYPRKEGDHDGKEKTQGKGYYCAERIAEPAMH